jgi:malonate transporter
MSPWLLFPDFATIALGYGIKRLWLAQPAWITVEKLVYFVLFPSLLFYSVVNSSAPIHSAPVFATGAAVVIGSGFVLGWLVWPLSHMGRVDFASGLQTAYRLNSYIGLALASRLGGPSAVADLAVLIAVGVPLSNFLAVCSMAQGGWFKALLEVLRNPLIIATSLGFVVKLMGWALPTPVALTLERLGQTAVSLGLLTVGAGLVFHGMRQHWLPAVYWTSIRLLILPIIAFAYSLATHLPASYTMALMVFSCLPAATGSYILALRMGGNSSLVAYLISMGTLASAFTIPLVFYWAYRLGL